MFGNNNFYTIEFFKGVLVDYNVFDCLMIAQPHNRYFIVGSPYILVISFILWEEAPETDRHYLSQTCVADEQIDQACIP